MGRRQVAAFLWALLACARPPLTSQQATGADAGEPSSPASPALQGPRPVPLKKAQASAEGADVSLIGDGETAIAPATSFRIELAGTFPDARLALHDEQDKLVPARGSIEVGATTVLTLAPTEPLRGGSPYRLRLDGTAERHVHDAQGLPHEPVELKVRTTGERQPPPPPEGTKKKRRRR
jgi:hypothetical protein